MSLLFLGATLALGAALFALSLVLSAVSPAKRPAYGRRGEQRASALERHGGFRLIEPLVLQVAAWVGSLVPERARASTEERLSRAGHWLGVTADEFVALTVLGVGAGGVIAVAGVKMNLFSAPAAALSIVALGGFPTFRRSAEEARRKKEMSRRLPAAIDLVALCMSAGVDFPRAIQFVAGEPEGRDLAREELALVAQELELGRTRSEAVAALGHRVPCDAVEGFVAAVVQAEEKGNPLAEILQIQASVLRAQRSVAAEEAAARAGVLMVGPLLLLLVCILVLLLGPFLLSGGL